MVRPHRFRGTVGVALGRDLVILPGTDGVVDVLAEFAAMTRDPPVESFSSGPNGAYDWPNAPRYLHDDGNAAPIE